MPETSAQFPLRLRQVPAGLFALTFTPDGKPHLLYTNEKWREMLDLPSSDMQADADLALSRLHPEDREALFRLRDQQNGSFEWIGRVKVRGETRWLQIEAFAAPDSGNRGIWHGVMTDITTQKQSEEELRNILENLPIPIIAGEFVNFEIPRHEAKITLLNRRFVETFGYTLDEVPTVACLRDALFPDPDLCEEIRSWWRSAVTRVPGGSGPVEMREMRMCCKDGTMRDVLVNATLSDGGPVVAIQDITELKATHLALQDSNRMMQLAAKAAMIGFWETDLRTGTRYWDDRMMEIYGIRREDFDGNWDGYVHPEDLQGAEDRARSAIETGESSFEQEFRIIRPDGETRHIKAYGTLTKDGNGRSILLTGVNYDITRERNAEESLRQAHEREKGAELEHRKDLERKLRTSLVAGAVAHEIKQPLSALLLQGNMTMESITRCSSQEDCRTYMSSTLANAERILKTADKIQALLHSVQTEHQTVRLAEVVQSAIRYSKVELEAVGAVLSQAGTQDQTICVCGDEGQLLLAVSNLLRNACHAVQECPAGERRIRVSLHRNGGTVELDVADSGPGLPEKILSKIPLHTTKPEGSGLGLFIVQAVAENHEARLEAGRSSLGGAKLKLLFPASGCHAG
ncbi:MAG: PAS domain-containing protein [Chthoniobacterales bacterium]|nr:PAS domain-containing protein [Chthoniobacterales bacterium]